MGRARRVGLVLEVKLLLDRRGVQHLMLVGSWVLSRVLHEAGRDGRVRLLKTVVAAAASTIIIIIFKLIHLMLLLLLHI